MADKDVTNKVKHSNEDDEMMAVYKCVCGEEWDAWDFIISIYRDTAAACDNCNRRFYFRSSVTIYEVIDDG